MLDLERVRCAVATSVSASFVSSGAQVVRQRLARVATAEFGEAGARAIELAVVRAARGCAAARPCAPRGESADAGGRVVERLTSASRRRRPRRDFDAMREPVTSMPRRRFGGSRCSRGVVAALALARWPCVRVRSRLRRGAASRPRRAGRRQSSAGPAAHAAVAGAGGGGAEARPAAQAYRPATRSSKTDRRAPAASCATARLRRRSRVGADCLRARAAIASTLRRSPCVGAARFGLRRRRCRGFGTRCRGRRRAARRFGRWLCRLPPPRPAPRNTATAASGSGRSCQAMPTASASDAAMPSPVGQARAGGVVRAADVDGVAPRPRVRGGEDPRIQRRRRLARARPGAPAVAPGRVLRASAVRDGWPVHSFNLARSLSIA